MCNCSFEFTDITFTIWKVENKAKLPHHGIKESLKSGCMPLKMMIKNFLTIGWINLKKPTLVMTKSLKKDVTRNFIKSLEFFWVPMMLERIDRENREVAELLQKGLLQKSYSVTVDEPIYADEPVLYTKLD